MPDTVHVAVTDASQVGEARRITARIAQAVGLDERGVGTATIIATELANNLYRYGGGGEILLLPVKAASEAQCGAELEITAVDRGAGMADVAACMCDGYSTGGTPGNGLGAVKRLSAEFDVYSLPGRGTVVLSRVRQETPRADVRPTGPVSWSAVTRFATGEEVCGDTWRVAEREGAMSILMADGLGHGPGAAEAAAAVAEAFAADSFAPPAIMMALAHRLAGPTRGAAVAVAQLDFSTRTLRYCGLGNIAGSLRGARDSRGLFSHNGTVGHLRPKFAEFEYPFPAGGEGLLVMHSDGLQSRWNLEHYPGLAARHPGVVAVVLARDFVRGRDDVTVLAVRLRP